MCRVIHFIQPVGLKAKISCMSSPSDKVLVLVKKHLDARLNELDAIVSDVKMPEQRATIYRKGLKQLISVLIVDPSGVCDEVSDALTIRLLTKSRQHTDHIQWAMSAFCRSTAITPTIDSIIQEMILADLAPPENHTIIEAHTVGVLLSLHCRSPTNGTACVDRLRQLFRSSRFGGGGQLCARILVRWQQALSETFCRLLDEYVVAQHDARLTEHQRIDLLQLLWLCNCLPLMNEVQNGSSRFNGNPFPFSAPTLAPAATYSDQPQAQQKRKRRKPSTTFTTTETTVATKRVKEDESAVALTLAPTSSDPKRILEQLSLLSQVAVDPKPESSTIIVDAKEGVSSRDEKGGSDGKSARADGSGKFSGGVKTGVVEISGVDLLLLCCSDDQHNRSIALLADDALPPHRKRVLLRTYNDRDERKVQWSALWGVEFVHSERLRKSLQEMLRAFIGRRKRELSALCRSATTHPFTTILSQVLADITDVGSTDAANDANSSPSTDKYGVQRLLWDGIWSRLTLGVGVQKIVHRHADDHVNRAGH